MDPKIYYTFTFDGDHSQNWTADDSLNRLFFRAIYSHLVQVLQQRRILFLNEVLEALGLERTSAGQTHGWLCESDIAFWDFDVMRTLESADTVPSYILTFAVSPNVHNRL